MCSIYWKQVQKHISCSKFAMDYFDAWKCWYTLEGSRKIFNFVPRCLKYDVKLSQKLISFESQYLLSHDCKTEKYAALPLIIKPLFILFIHFQKLRNPSILAIREFFFRIHNFLGLNISHQVPPKITTCSQHTNSCKIWHTWSWRW